MIGCRASFVAAIASDILFAGVVPGHAQSDVTMIGSWEYRCDAGQCRGMMGVKDRDRVMFGWVIQRTQDDEIAVLIRVPLGAVLPQGVRVYTSQEYYFGLTYQTCTAAGCDAVVRLDASIEEQMKTSDGVRVAYFLEDASGGSKGYSISVKVDGFGDLIRALRDGEGQGAQMP